jgi:hypothetical protein
MRAGKIGRAGALAAVTAVGIAAFATGGASADESGATARADQDATITIALEGKDLFFKGGKKVSHGANLKIVNKTSPKDVGPHTFTLVKKKLLPDDKQEIKDCEHLKLEVCQDVAAAHKVDLQTFEVNKRIVDRGEKGWDKPFGHKGDTWFVNGEGKSNEREVSAKAGTTLHYFCIVHPFMQGKVKVK